MILNILFCTAIILIAVLFVNHVNSKRIHIKNFRMAYKKKRVSRHELCNDGVNMEGYKYNESTIFNSDWDVITCNARGIVFNSDTGEILARPFRKFFNYGELFNTNDTVGHTEDILKLGKLLKGIYGCDPSTVVLHKSHFRLMDKLDGSLGILFYTGKKWLVKTGGSFQSEQAEWANNWANKNIDASKLEKGYTYCFEIIADEDKHPINYDYEAMVLLSKISNESGDEEPLEVIRDTARLLNVRMAEVIEFDDFDKMVDYAVALPSTKEGVVVTFDNGFKLKVKGTEFLKMQKLFHSLSYETIWENFNAEEGEFNKGTVEQIPEEMPELKDYATWLKDEFNGRIKIISDSIDEYGAKLKNGMSRKDIYKEVSNKYNGYIVSGIMRGVSNIEKGIPVNPNDIRINAYRSLKPNDK